MLSFYNLNLWVHIFSAVAWLGAILYTWWVLLPAMLSSFSRPEAIVRITSVEIKFRRVAHPFIALIAITGVLNLMNSDAIVKFKTVPFFGILVTVKVVILAALIFLHVLRLKTYAGKILHTSVDGKAGEAGLDAWGKSKSILIIQALLGMLLIFLGINLR